MESSSKAMIISWPRPISGFKLETQCPLAKKPLKKCYPPWLADEENSIILNSNAYPEMVGKEICFVDPVGCFSLYYLLLIAFHFIALLIAFSK